MSGSRSARTAGPGATLAPAIGALVDALIALALLGAAFFAIAAQDAGAAYASALWSALPVLFLLGALTIGWAHGDYGRAPAPWRLVALDAAHWGATLIAIRATLGFIETGFPEGLLEAAQVERTGAGLICGVVLALSTGLAGIHTHWRLAPIGLAVLGACYAVVLIEEHVWATMSLAVAGLAGMVALGRVRARRERRAG